MSNYLMQTYGRLPVTFESGDGVWLTDNKGEQYFDALSGIAVCNLGHAHPAVTQAISEQAGKLVHTSNLYQIDQQTQLAEKLCKVAGMERAFFGNSGAEANEAMIKIARLFGNKKGIENPTIIVTNGAFHGRTMATLSATGNPKVQQGFEPLVSGFVHVPYNDITAINDTIEMDRNIVAVLVEPIQGEGGINIPDADYLTNIRALCDEHGLLMLLDEIQTGVGRSGEWFAYQNQCSTACLNNSCKDCATPTCGRPDVMTSAKGLGNGVPIGACLARGAAADIFAPGNHGSTFGGNPLACAAANAVLDVIDEQSLLERTKTLNKRICDAFSKEFTDEPAVVDIRSVGLLIGIELKQDCTNIVQIALENKCLLNVTAGNVVRLLPPLNMTDEEADILIERVTTSIRTFITA